MTSVSVENILRLAEASNGSCIWCGSPNISSGGEHTELCPVPALSTALSRLGVAEARAERLASVLSLVADDVRERAWLEYGRQEE